MIPVIDLTDYLRGEPGAARRTAREIHDAFSRIGFFVITGHDVPSRLIEQTFAEAKRLHDLPMTRGVYRASTNLGTRSAVCSSSP